tara:strand:+ start:1000 stop:1704 length:705 start_codon:yes stop_codon:yes gene_type:complete
MNKIVYKYFFEFIVIVFGITISFYLEDYRQKEEMKTLSLALKKNLLNEIYEIEKYLEEREIAFKGDQKLLLALQDESLKVDSIFKIQDKPYLYGAALFNYRGFGPPVAFYNSLVNDGKIRYLESSDLKKELDLMHNVHYSYVKSNVQDEAIAQRKVMDYFQINYPRLFILSDSDKPNKTYAKKIKNAIDNDVTLRAILYQKSLAIQQKVVGFDRYKKSLIELKKLLLGDSEIIN